MYILHGLGRLFVSLVIAVLTFGGLQLCHLPDALAGFFAGIVFIISILARRSITEVEHDDELED